MFIVQLALIFTAKSKDGLIDISNFYFCRFAHNFVVFKSNRLFRSKILIEIGSAIPEKAINEACLAF